MMNTLEKQLFRTYVNIYRPLLNRLNEMLRPFNITNAQFMVLNLLMYEEELTPFEIAKHQNVEKSTITQSIQKLSTTGYININPGKEDKREKRITLTEKGKMICTHVNEQLQNLYKELLTEIPEQEIKTSIRVLEEILKKLEN